MKLIKDPRRKSDKRVVTSIRIKSSILEEAKQHNINLSASVEKFVENELNKLKKLSDKGS
jgi:post-segregation antitoxin (ccd killing protein)